MSSPFPDIGRPLPSALASLGCFCLIIIGAGHGAAPAGLMIFWQAIGISIWAELRPFEAFAAVTAWGNLLLFPTLILLRNRKAFITVSAVAMFCLWASWIRLLVVAEAKGIMVATSMPFFIAQIFWVLGFTRYLGNKS